MTILVRPFEVEDVAWAAPLADRLFADLDQDYGAAVATWAVDPTGFGFAAEGPAGPIGFALAGAIGLIGPDRPRVIELRAIGVRAEARRLGYGRTLVARVLQQARADAGVLEVRLTVAADNLAARRLFEQAGFAVAREDDGTFPGGQLAVRMRLVPPVRRGPPAP